MKKTTKVVAPKTTTAVAVKKVSKVKSHFGKNKTGKTILTINDGSVHLNLYSERWCFLNKVKDLFGLWKVAVKKSDRNVAHFMKILSERKITPTATQLKVINLIDNTKFQAIYQENIDGGEFDYKI